MLDTPENFIRDMLRVAEHKENYTDCEHCIYEHAICQYRCRTILKFYEDWRDRVRTQETAKVS